MWTPSPAPPNDVQLSILGIGSWISRDKGIWRLPIRACHSEVLENQKEVILGAECLANSTIGLFRWILQVCPVRLVCIHPVGYAACHAETCSGRLCRGLFCPDPISRPRSINSRSGLLPTPK